MANVSQWFSSNQPAAHCLVETFPIVQPWPVRITREETTGRAGVGGGCRICQIKQCRCCNCYDAACHARRQKHGKCCPDRRMRDASGSQAPNENTVTGVTVAEQGDLDRERGAAENRQYASTMSARVSILQTSLTAGLALGHPSPPAYATRSHLEAPGVPRTLVRR